NIVDLMTLQPSEEHPHGLSDRDFDEIFTTDKPVIFAYHGYPWLIHRLTYRRRNHDNVHVRGYKEEGTTTTPFDMVVLNDLDRFHLVMDAADRVPALADRAAYLKQRMRDKRTEHKRYIVRMARTCRKSGTGSGRTEASVRHEHRNGHRLQHRSRDAAQNELAHPRMAVGAHHDEVASEIRRARQQPLARRDIGGFVADHIGVHAMRMQPCKKARFGEVLADIVVAFRRNHDHGDALRALEQRQRISDRARRLAPTVPRDEHVFTHRRRCADVRHHQHGAPARQHDARDEIFGKDRTGRIALTHDDEIAAAAVGNRGVDR